MSTSIIYHIFTACLHRTRLPHTCPLCDNRSNATSAAYAVGHDAVLRTLQAAVGPTDVIVANNYAIPGVLATMLEEFAASGASIRQLQSLAEQVRKGLTEEPPV